MLQDRTSSAQGIASILARDDAETIAWMAYGRPSSSVMLYAAPLQVAEAFAGASSRTARSPF